MAFEGETTEERFARIWRTMGFRDTDTGPYAAELAVVVQRQIAEGMTFRSYGTWVREDLSAEERARSLMEVEWALQHGHARQTELVDPILFMRTSFRSGKMRRYPVLRVRRVPAWLRDKARYAAYLWRIHVRDRGLKNPYAKNTT